MPTNLSGRVGLILAVLFVAVWTIFPSGDVTKPNLKPGIDMVGGTSLLYEIRVPAGGANSGLVEQVMAALKKRVDPDGLRNLIWRPQGSTRLEIQMPMTAQSRQMDAPRQRFAEAQQQLEATNIRTRDVFLAVQELSGEARLRKLKELEHSSEKRATLFGAMNSTWDQIQRAKEAKNAPQQAQLELDYQKLVDQLADTNLREADLQAILDQPGADARNKAIEELKKRNADFPQRMAAIDSFISAYADYSKVKGAIDDAAELKRLLRGSGVLEFHILASDLPPLEYQAMRERLHRRGPRPQAGDTTRWYQLDRDAEVVAEVEKAVQELSHTEGDRARRDLIKRAAQGRVHVEELYNELLTRLNDPAQRSALQKQIEDALLGVGPIEDYGGRKYVLAYTTPDKSMAHREGQPAWALKRAFLSQDQGENKIGFEFDPQGGRIFGDLTAAHVQRPMAIVLDDKIISAPNINHPITGGNGVIESGQRGGFSVDEVRYMVNTLNAGALTAQLTEEPISERTVGPQLGEDNLRRGLYACYFGLVVVAVFLIGYYYLAGVVATIAVLMNMVLILGAMAAMQASFTLPGIAGIVLTIGMAVDANVLIFERLREEQLRGLSLRMALRNAYDRAFSAILDGNLTTGITAAALYVFGSEEIRGFGLTLLLGIVSSMFTALYVTKTLFAFLVDRMGVQRLSSVPLTFPKWDRLLKPNIDWMSKAWAFYAFSAVFIVIGLLLFSVRLYHGQMLDIEFASGTAVQFELKEPMTREAVEKLIEEKASPETIVAPTVVTVGDDGKTYELVTLNQNTVEVRNALLNVLGNQLNVTIPSGFAFDSIAAGEAMNQAIFPIVDSTSAISGQIPSALGRHVGGVAVVLKNLDPPIQEADLKSRIQQQRLQPQVGSGSAKRYANLDVETSEGGRTAVVMASDPDLEFDKTDPIKEQQWTDELAAPTWNLVRDAVTKPADLQKVTNFDAQIAGETQQQAMIALFLSIGAIMIYIWIRFGNLKYGTATVVALLHDTLFTLAAVGFAHYLAGTFLGEATMIQPFRINLTLVAAILTIMGYSMNDTVVVFDRIRENRGKFGHVDRAVVNDSINQTLSRTLLTGGTTIVTIFVMYIWGGPGIHGFTFALLVGILVGTYSSIAIASPILLWGQASAKDAAGPRKGSAARQGQFQGA